MARTVPLSPHHVTAGTAALRAGGIADADAIRDFLALVTLRDLDRGEHLLRPGERASEVVWVVRGFLREYYLLPDGAECTKAFVLECRPSGSLSDLLAGGRARGGVVADEASRVAVFAYSRYVALVDKWPDFRRAQRKLLEQLVIAKQNREYELLGLDAEARYDQFRRRFPGLEGRVAARHVASYLGITPEHLSRLRRRRRLHGRATAQRQDAPARTTSLEQCRS